MKSYIHVTSLVLLITICLALPNNILASGEKPAGLKIIYVVTDDQKLYAWEENQLLYEFDVVTGRPGKETHPGVFKIFRKHKDYTSKTTRVFTGAQSKRVLASSLVRPTQPCEPTDSVM